MIRINLLSEGRRPVIARKTRPKLSLGDQDPSLILLASGLLIGLLVVGFQWWRLSGQLKDVNDKVGQARVTVDQLRPILEKVEDFKTKQVELQRKIDVINELTLKQQGPVHIMDSVSRALPDLLWISGMAVRGETVELSGAAFNTNAVAQFIESLNEVPEFKEPDPGNVQATRNGTYDFRIRFNFRQELPEGAEGEGGEAGEI